MWDYLFAKTITLDPIYIYLYVGIWLVRLCLWAHGGLFACLFVLQGSSVRVGAIIFILLGI